MIKELLISLASFATCAALTSGCHAQTVGGCQTSEREYGLPTLADSLAQAALGELMGPSVARHEESPEIRALGIDTPFFAQIGAVVPPPDSAWIALASQLTKEISDHGLRIAQRSLLRHTTGTCFPPYHVDLQAVGDSAAAASFLSDLPKMIWQGFVPTQNRSERIFFIAAGTSMELMNAVVDLK